MRIFPFAHYLQSAGQTLDVQREFGAFLSDEGGEQCGFCAPGLIMTVLAMARELLDGTGAVRVHGGGFAGTIQAFVPEDRLALFKSGMEALLGQGKCHILHIRPQGGCVVAE